MQPHGPVQEVTSRRLQRTDTSRSKSLAPGSPPSRPLRAASGGEPGAADNHRDERTITSASRSMPKTEEKACPDQSRLLTTTSPYKPGWSGAKSGTHATPAPDFAEPVIGRRFAPKARRAHQFTLCGGHGAGAPLPSTNLH